MAETTEPEVIELRLIPPPALMLTRRVASRWLREDSGDWVRALACGFAPTVSQRARDAFDQLSLDVAQLADACGRVIASGQAERLGQDVKDFERNEIACEIASILASRPSEAMGAYGSMFDVLADRLVELLAEREAA